MKLSVIPQLRNCCKRGHYSHYIESVIKVFLVKLTEKRPILSCRSSTSFTSTHVFLFVGVCHAPASMPRPGRQGRTLLANCRQSGHVNSPLSTEKPWRTWSFWGTTKDNLDWICLITQFLRMWLQTQGGTTLLFHYIYKVMFFVLTFHKSA